MTEERKKRMKVDMKEAKKERKKTSEKWRREGGLDLIVRERERERESAIM